MKIDSKLELAVLESIQRLEYELGQAAAHADLFRESQVERVQMKGAICLTARNVWDGFLFGLGEFDPGRSSPGYSYSDASRVKLAPKWPQMADTVLNILKRSHDAVEKLKDDEGDEGDEYYKAVTLKYEKLRAVLQ